MEFLVPISCLLPWDLFEKILGSVGCPHICYHICRQLCKKTRKELLPRLVDWYFVEWWYPDQTNNLQQWTTMSCMWKVHSEKHMKTTKITKQRNNVRMMPIEHVRFCIPFKKGRTKNGTYPIVFQRKKSNHFDVKMQLVHTYESDKYILGGYATINSGERKGAYIVKVGDFVLTESGKFKHVVEKGKIKGIKTCWLWFIFKNPKHNMHLDEYDEVIIL